MTMTGRRYKDMVAGVDEVGRGCLAGAVFAAAVILPDGDSVTGLRDSKRLSARKREKLATAIRARSVDWAIGQASVQEIDRLNILRATLLAMERAVRALRIQPDQVLIDGVHCPDIEIPTRSIIGGDACEPTIMAASILAKVTRDSVMMHLETEFPGFAFAKNKGYGTAAHIEALKMHGPTIHHRMTFAPCSRLALDKNQDAGLPNHRSGVNE